MPPSTSEMLGLKAVVARGAAAGAGAGGDRRPALRWPPAARCGRILRLRPRPPAHPAGAVRAPAGALRRIASFPRSGRGWRPVHCRRRRRRTGAMRMRRQAPASGRSVFNMVFFQSNREWRAASGKAQEGHGNKRISRRRKAVRASGRRRRCAARLGAAKAPARSACRSSGTNWRGVLPMAPAIWAKARHWLQLLVLGDRAGQVFLPLVRRARRGRMRARRSCRSSATSHAQTPSAGTPAEAATAGRGRWNDGS